MLMLCLSKNLNFAKQIIRIIILECTRCTYSVNKNQKKRKGRMKMNLVLTVKEKRKTGLCLTYSRLLH